MKPPAVPLTHRAPLLGVMQPAQHTCSSISTSHPPIVGDNITSCSQHICPFVSFMHPLVHVPVFVTCTHPLCGTAWRTAASTLLHPGHLPAARRADGAQTAGAPGLLASPVRVCRLLCMDVESAKLCCVWRTNSSGSWAASVPCAQLCFIRNV